jgi:hypothetical protein
MRNITTNKADILYAQPLFLRNEYETKKRPAKNKIPKPVTDSTNTRNTINHPIKKINKILDTDFFSLFRIIK